MSTLPEQRGRPRYSAASMGKPGFAPQAVRAGGAEQATPTKLPPPAAHLKNDKTRSGPHPASDLDRCQSRESGSAATFRDGKTIPLPLSGHRHECSSMTFADEPSGGREEALARAGVRWRNERPPTVLAGSAGDTLDTGRQHRLQKPQSAVARRLRLAVAPDAHVEGCLP